MKRSTARLRFPPLLFAALGGFFLPLLELAFSALRRARRQIRHARGGLDVVAVGDFSAGEDHSNARSVLGRLPRPAALFALIGSLVALLGSSTYANAIAWAMWFGGAVTVFLVAQSDRPAHPPQSPSVLIPAGLLVIGLGALIFIVTA